MVIYKIIRSAAYSADYVQIPTCNSYIIKYLKFSTRNYSIAGKKRPQACSEDMHRASTFTHTPNFILTE